MLPIKKRVQDSRSVEIGTSPSVKKKPDKDKENSTSISSGSKQCVRRMTGHLYKKSLLNKPRIKKKISDIDAELEGLDKAAASSDKIGKLDVGSSQRELIKSTVKQNSKRVPFLGESDIENADVAKKRKLAVIEEVGPAERDTRGAEGRNEETKNDAIKVDKRSLLLPSDKMNIKENSSNKEKNILKKKRAANDNENRKRGLSPSKSDNENADVAKKHKRAVMENVAPASVGGSERDTCGADERNEEIQNDAINVDERSPLLSSVKVNMEENSTNEEKNEEDNYTMFGSGIDYKTYQVQKECKKRMKKLIQKQKEEIQEFHRVWDAKKSKLELDHKVESAFIRYNFKQAPARFDKLNVVDGKLAKAMEEHNVLKEKQLKDLKEEQLSAVDAEKQKAAHFLAQILESSDGTKDSPQVEKDSSERSILAATAEKVPDVMETVEMNEAVLSEVLETVPDETVDRVDHSELSDALDKGCDEVDLVDAFVDQREETEEITAGVLPEPPEQTEDASNHCDVLPLQVPEAECHQGLSDEVQDGGANVVEKQNYQHNKIATSEQISTFTTNTEVENRDTPVVEIQSTSHIESPPLDLIDTVNPEPSNVDTQPLEAESQLPDMQIESPPLDLINTVNPEPSNVDTQPLEAESQLPDMQIESPPLDLTDTVNPEPSNVDTQPLEAESQLPDMQIISSQTTDGAANEPQDQRANMVDNQNDLQHKVVTQEPIDTSAIITQSSTDPENRDVQVTESTSTSQIESPPLNLIHTVNPEPLIILDRDAPVIEDQDTLQNEATNPTPVDNVESQTADCALNELPHEIPTNHIDAGSLITVSHETSVEILPSMPNDVNISQTEVDMYDILNQGDLQLELDLGPLDGSNHLFPHPGHQVTSFNSSYRTAGPLDNEFERIRKETEQLEKTHQESVSRMKSDFENKIKEMIAQIRKEYETKHQEAEAEFRSKKNELEKNGKIVLMHKILAEAFSADLSSFHLPYNFTQYRTVRPPPAVSPSHTVQAMQNIPSQTVQAMQHIPSQTVQAMQHIPNQTVQALLHIPNQTVQAMQHIPSRTVQAMQHIPSRTVQGLQQIPSQTAQALQHSSLPQSLTPHHHFQAYQSPAAAAQPIPYSNLPLMRYYSTQQQHLGATHAPSNSGYIHLHQGAPQAQLGSFVLTADSVRASLDYQRHLAGNRYFSSVGNVQGNQASFGLPVDAVCLSDDD